MPCPCPSDLALQMFNPKFLLMKTTIQSASDALPIIVQLAQKWHTFRKIHLIISYLVFMLSKLKTFEEARSAALYKILGYCQPTLEQQKGLKTKFETCQMTSANCLLFTAITHPYFLGQNVTADTLMVVNGKSLLGKCLLSDAHIHVSSPSKEIASVHK